MTHETDLRHWTRTQREWFAITQAQLAHHTGLTYDKVCKLETGKRGISWDEGWTIIQALHALKPTDKDFTADPPLPSSDPTR